MRASSVSQGTLSEEIMTISFHFSLTEGQNELFNNWLWVN